MRQKDRPRRQPTGGVTVIVATTTTLIPDDYAPTPDGVMSTLDQDLADARHDLVQAHLGVAQKDSKEARAKVTAANERMDALLDLHFELLMAGEQGR